MLQVRCLYYVPSRLASGNDAARSRKDPRIHSISGTESGGQETGADLPRIPTQHSVGRTDFRHIEVLIIHHAWKHFRLYGQFNLLDHATKTMLLWSRYCMYRSQPAVERVLRAAGTLGLE